MDPEVKGRVQLLVGENVCFFNSVRRFIILILSLSSHNVGSQCDRCFFRESDLFFPGSFRPLTHHRK